jgi:hypothetical protein
MARSSDSLDLAKRVMGALLRQPPKPHDDMKIGKPKSKRAKAQKKPSAKKRRS